MLKKVIWCSIFIYLNLLVFSQEPFTEYRFITNYSNIPIITLTTIDDLIEIAKISKIKSALIRVDEKNRKDTQILVFDKNVYYQFQLKGYFSVSNYIDGNIEKFENGDDYYNAKELNINNGELYAYYRNNSFLNVDDCKQAFSSGFVFDKYPFYKIVVPEVLTEEQHSFLLKNIPFYSSYWSYTYNNVFALKDKNNCYIASRETIGNREKNEIKEYQIFYISKILNLKTYANYLEYFDIKEHGFNNVRDFNDSKLKGFVEGKDYYNAINNGFDKYIDFKKAKQMEILTYSEYKSYEDIINQVEFLTSSKKMDQNSAIINYYILSIPKGKSFSLVKLSEYIKYEINKTPNINKYYQAIYYDESSLSNFFNKNDIENIGKYDKDGGIFTKK